MPRPIMNLYKSQFISSTFVGKKKKKNGRIIAPLFSVDMWCIYHAVPNKSPYTLSHWKTAMVNLMESNWTPDHIHILLTHCGPTHFLSQIFVIFGNVTPLGSQVKIQFEFFF